MTESHWLKDNPYQRSDGTKGYYIHDQATRYAMRIVQKEVPTPDAIVKVCERHLDDIDKSKMPGSPIIWDYGELIRFNQFCQTYCMVEDKINSCLTPLKLLDPFALAYGLVLGWKMNNPNADPQVDKLRRKHLSRRYRSLFMETPKGSGKTPVAAAYVLYHMAGLNPPPTVDGEQPYSRPLVFIATDLESQANVIKGYMHTMRENSKFFSIGGVDITYGREEFFCSSTQASCIFKSARGRGHGTSGFIPSLLVVEEAQDHETLDLYERITMGFKSQTQPLTIFCLNAGKRLDSAFWVERQKAGKVADGIVHLDNYLPMIWGVDARDEPLEDETCWRKVYPTLGVTIDRDYIQERVQFAKSSTQRKAEVLRLNFGVWTRGMQSDWIDFSVIEKCFAKERPKRKDWHKLPLVVGLDLSRSTSLTGFAQAWYLPNDTVWIEADGYTCDKGYKGILDEADYLPIEEWIEKEDGIQMADTIRGESIDFDPIAERLFQISEEYNLVAVAIDSFHKDRFYDALIKYTDNFVKDTDQRRVLGGLRFFEHKNDKRRVKLPLPGKQEEWLYFHDTIGRMEERISKKKIGFLDNATLAWNFGCMIVQRSGESLVMMKRDAKEARGGRIDLVAASIYALGVLEKTVIRSEQRNTRIDRFISLQENFAGVLSGELSETQTERI